MLFGREILRGEEKKGENVKEKGYEKKGSERVQKMQKRENLCAPGGISFSERG
jgi:hypothetical protein